MKKIKFWLKPTRNKIIVGLSALCIIVLVSVTVIHAMNESKKAKEAELARQTEVLKSVEITQRMTDLEYGYEYKLSDLLTIKAIDGVTVSVVTNGMPFEDGTVINYVELGSQAYTVTLSYGDSTESREFTYEVKDTQAPVIDGTKDYTITVGDSLDYKSSVKASDPVDGNLEVTFSGDVDVTKAGTYTVKASATDKNNNTSDKEFKIVVKNKEVTPSNPSTSGSSSSGGSNTGGTSSNGNSENSSNNSSGSSSNGGSSNTCTPNPNLIGNSGKDFNSEAEAIAWAEQYLDENFREVAGYSTIGPMCGKYYVNLRYYD